MKATVYRSSLAVVLAGFFAVGQVAPSLAQQSSGSGQQTGQAGGQQTQGQQNPPAANQAAAPQTPPEKRVIPMGPDYSHAKRQFPDFINVYTPRRVPEPVLVNSPRVEQMIHDGRLELSLQDAISLALENNLDIAIQRYVPWIAETTVLLAKTQSAVPGLNIDPLITSNLLWDRNSIPVNNPILSGTTGALASLNQNTARYNFLYSQGFMSGTSFTAGWNNSRQSSSLTSNTFNPSVNSNLALGFNQPILNGFGFAQNRANLLIARNSKAIADYTFQQQLFTSIAAVATNYWEVVFAREDVGVQQQSVALAQKLYDDNVKQVEIGTLAHIDVTRAEAQLESAKAALVQSQTNLLQQQVLLKNLISKNPLDPLLANAEVVPTDKPVEPQFDIIPIQDAVQEALGKRPDVLTAKTTLLSDDVSVRATRHALLPVLDLTGQYNMAGLSGNSRIVGNPSVIAGNPVVDANGHPIPGFFLPTTTVPVLGTNTSGLGGALSSVFQSQFPDYNVGVTLSIPIRNRAGQAANERAILQERQDELQYRKVQNQVVVDIRNAQIALTQDHAQIASATRAHALSAETLDAENKKYALGASTVFQIIQDQRDLSTAESTEIRSTINMIEAKITFDRVMGRLLEVNNITIADAKTGGAPSREMLIPGTPTKAAVLPTKAVETFDFRQLFNAQPK